MITYGAAGAVAYSAAAGTSVAPPYPTGISATGQMLILVVGQKPATANGGTVTTPAGWGLTASHTAQGGYSTTLGADTGNTNLFIYTKTADGSETGSLTVTVGGNNVCWAYIARITTTSSNWLAPGVATGSSATDPTFALSATTGSMNLETGDMLFYAWSFATDTAGSWADAPSMTAPGSYIQQATVLVAPASANGNDIGGNSGYAWVGTGAGAGAVTWSRNSYNSLTGFRGPFIVVRFREFPVTIPTSLNRAYAAELHAADTATPIPLQKVFAVEALTAEREAVNPLQRIYAVEMLVVEEVLPAPTNDCWVWNGTAEVAANVTVWNGTAEIEASLEVV